MTWNQQCGASFSHPLPFADSDLRSGGPATNKKSRLRGWNSRAVGSGCITDGRDSRSSGNEDSKYGRMRKSSALELTTPVQQQGELRHGVLPARKRSGTDRQLESLTALGSAAGPGPPHPSRLHQQGEDPLGLAWIGEYSQHIPQLHQLRPRLVPQQLSEGLVGEQEMPPAVEAPHRRRQRIQQQAIETRPPAGGRPRPGAESRSMP